MAVADLKLGTAGGRLWVGASYWVAVCCPKYWPILSRKQPIPAEHMQPQCRQVLLTWDSDKGGPVHACWRVVDATSVVVVPTGEGQAGTLSTTLDDLTTIDRTTQALQHWPPPGSGDSGEYDSRPPLLATENRLRWQPMPTPVASDSWGIAWHTAGYWPALAATTTSDLHRAVDDMLRVAQTLALTCTVTAPGSLVQVPEGDLPRQHSWWGNALGDPPSYWVRQTHGSDGYTCPNSATALVAVPATGPLAPTDTGSYYVAAAVVMPTAEYAHWVDLVVTGDDLLKQRLPGVVLLAGQYQNPTDWRLASVIRRQADVGDTRLDLGAEYQLKVAPAPQQGQPHAGSVADMLLGLSDVLPTMWSLNSDLHSWADVCDRYYRQRIQRDVALITDCPPGAYSDT